MNAAADQARSWLAGVSPQSGQLPNIPHMSTITAISTQAGERAPRTRAKRAADRLRPAGYPELPFYR
jgi:hypothetical protein